MTPIKPRDILFKDEMRAKLSEGAKKIYDVVRITMGAKGRNVIFDQENDDPFILNDGVRCAREVLLADKWERLSASLIRQASEKTNRNAGDGTSLTIVLAYAILIEGLKNIKEGFNPMVLKNEIQEAAKEVVKLINEVAVPVKEADQIRDIATVSSQSEEIGESISEIVKKVGRDMPITVERGGPPGISNKIIDGMQFEKGYISPGFITDPTKMRFDRQECLIAIIDKRLSTKEDVIPILRPLINQAKNGAIEFINLVIVATDLESEAFAILAQNHIKGLLEIQNLKIPISICCVNPMHYGQLKIDFMQDLALTTGASCYSEEDALNLKNFKYEDFGSADRVLVDMFNTTIIGGNGNKEKVEKRIQEVAALREQAEDENSEDIFDRRISMLKGGVGMLLVSAKTKNEDDELMLRVEDAVLATKSAISEGVVTGGGKTLYNISKSPIGAKNTTGVKVIADALEYPIKQIIENAGGTVEEEMSTIVMAGLDDGYNVLNGEIENLKEKGIIDPAKVLREAIENASSIASMLLTTECALTYAE